MNKDYIFSKSNLAGINLNNRIIRAATEECWGDKTGGSTEMLIRFYEKLAHGEARNDYYWLHSCI